MQNIETTAPRFLVMESAACMPANCWGKYRRIAVVKLAPGFTGYPKMISERAIGVSSIVALWDRQFSGKSDRCAAAIARAEAVEMAAELNAARSTS